MQLTVTDVNNNQTVTTQDIGAVAMDSKGIVVNADPNADAMFGNMIAFGQNPWGFADYWEEHAMYLRLADYTASGWGISGPQWEQTGAGTVSYYWNGVGISPGDRSCFSTLTAGITAATLSIPISNASCLDFTAFPTRILLAAGGAPEEVRICSSSATSGPATLTVCYDGRGQNAASWNAGSLIGQDKVTGSGTKFITDPVAAVCPGGAPGPTGSCVIRKRRCYSDGRLGHHDGVGHRLDIRDGEFIRARACNSRRYAIYLYRSGYRGGFGYIDHAQPCLSRRCGHWLVPSRDPSRVPDDRSPWPAYCRHERDRLMVV